MQSGNAKDSLDELLLELALEYRVAEKKLARFVQAAWDVLEPKTPLKWNWHHSYICEHLEAIANDQIKRLIINVPPRTGKSTLVTICFPVWLWIRKPEERFLFGSYADALARKHSILRRALIESTWFQKGWDDRFQLRHDLNTKSEFGNDKTGQMKAAGILGSVTGEGANWLVFDDPHNPKKVESENDRDGILTSVDQVWMSRLNDRDKDKVLLVMQRTHDEDLTGHFLKTGQYEHVLLPLEEEQERTLYFPMSKKILNRIPGEELHPDRLGLRHKDQLIKDLGQWAYGAQYQQNPIPRTGGIIKRDWLRFYSQLPAHLHDYRLSWDMAFKGTKNSDYVVGQVWARVGGSFFLVDQVRARMDFPATRMAFKAQSAKYPQAIRKIVEEKANGAAIIDSLKLEIPGIIPYRPTDSKEARLSSVAPCFEAGNVYLPDSSIASWMNDYIEELVGFGSMKNDDQVDASVQALIDYLGSPGGIFTKAMAEAKATPIFNEDQHSSLEW